MKRAITSLLMTIIMLLIVGGQAAGQTTKATDGFHQYMASSVKYPEKARLKNLQGNSVILFTLNKGKLITLKIDVELGEGTEVVVLNTLMAYQDLKSLRDGKYALITSFRLNGSSTTIANENAKAPEGYISLKVTITAESPINNVALVTGYDKSAKTILVNEPGYQNVILRGNPFGSPLNPKVIIDSVQIDYDELKYVLPDRIQSIHIYRGPSAMENYGPAAANGVIVIVTKKDQKLIIKKDTTNMVQDDENVYNFVSMKNPPTYPGGMVSFYKFLLSNVKNPDSEIQGNVHVSFIIEKDGSLTNIKTLRKLGKAQDEEAIRVIKLSKKWNPGLIDDKPVRVSYSLPVKFN